MSSRRNVAFREREISLRARRLRRVVLVVEDDPDALDAITAILEDAGYDALRAANGPEALRQLADHKGRCDLILLDLLMPVMNGWDFPSQAAGNARLRRHPGPADVGRALTWPPSAAS